MAVITVDGFSKKYGNFLAVDNISFSVEQGEIVGFVGKNGAGKSTTIHALLNFIALTSGTMTLKGLDSVKDAKKIREVVGYMPSDTLYYPITVKELFHFYCDFHSIPYEEATKLLAYFELDESKAIADLSLGNRKKVAIIQMFLGDKDIIILDEPTSGLDPFMQDKFFDLLLQKKKMGKTVFMSSHNLSEIEKYCDRALIIKDGKIIDDVDLKNITIQKSWVVTYKTKEGKEEKFDWNEDANALIQKLASFDLTQLEIKHKSVEDEFIKYYKEEK